MVYGFHFFSGFIGFVLVEFSLESYKFFVELFFIEIA